jgi:hypothetical protein
MLKNQNDWGPWAKKDPNMKVEYRGTDGTPGFVSAWKSDNSDLGEGEQEIKKIADGERVDTELRFKKPFEATNNSYMLTEAAGENQTKVKWGFSGSVPKPFNVMCLFMTWIKWLETNFRKALTLSRQSWNIDTRRRRVTLCRRFPRTDKLDRRWAAVCYHHLSFPSET